MRDSENAFHLAIPCNDLLATWSFYVDGLGCPRGTRYEDRITLDFFGDQLVCHLSPRHTVSQPSIYPRHFGMTLASRQEFDSIHRRAKRKGLTFFKDLFVRFSGQANEHRCFFLCDPSNNLIEFKHYESPETMF